MPEFRLLLTLFLAAGAFWVFEEVQEELSSGRGRAIDRAILLAFRSSSDPGAPLGPPWLQTWMRDITALGSLGVLGLVIGASVTFLFIARKQRDGWVVLAATVGGIIATQALKAFFNRPRPDLLLPGMYVYSSSFPSGHAIMSAVTYLTLGALIARKVRGYLLKTYVISASVVLTLLVGITRVYLGAHWPSDVVAGWSVGAAWALLCWAAAEWFERRGSSQ
jgi:undecaprenyl-diphosphatase